VLHTERNFSILCRTLILAIVAKGKREGRYRRVKKSPKNSTVLENRESPIQLAGEVKARGDRRRGRSDSMAIERERGISVSSGLFDR
jgi:hypothetical protein